MDVMELKMSLKKQVNLYSVRASFEVVRVAVRLIPMDKI